MRLLSNRTRLGSRGGAQPMIANRRSTITHLPAGLPYPPLGPRVCAAGCWLRVAGAVVTLAHPVCAHRCFAANRAPTAGREPECRRRGEKVPGLAAAVASINASHGWMTDAGSSPVIARWAADGVTSTYNTYIVEREEAAGQAHLQGGGHASHTTGRCCVSGGLQLMTASTC